MPRRIVRQLQSDRGLEWFSALVMVGWAVVLLQDGDTLANGNLREMLRYGMTEIKVTAVFGFTGCARLAALYINGRWPKSPIIRMFGSLVGFVLWAQITFFLLAGSALVNGVVTTGVAVYGLLALADFLSIYRAAFDARYYAR